MPTILNLDNRLQAIIELCDYNKVMADVGCDHGYVTAELILQDKASRVIATEISRECLNKAIRFADSMNLIPFISFREGDGFANVSKYDKVDQAVIAGMGGYEIIHILESKPSNLWNFVLQPMTDVIAVREWLLSNGLKIVVDKLVKDGDKYYNIIKCEKGKQKLTELELYFGLSNFTDNYVVLYEYLNKRKEKLEAINTKFGELKYDNAVELNMVYQALALFNPEDAEENVIEQDSGYEPEQYLQGEYTQGEYPEYTQPAEAQSTLENTQNVASVEPEKPVEESLGIQEQNSNVSQEETPKVAGKRGRKKSTKKSTDYLSDEKISQSYDKTAEKIEKLTPNVFDLDLSADWNGAYILDGSSETEEKPVKKSNTKTKSKKSTK